MLVASDSSTNFFLQQGSLIVITGEGEGEGGS
jgi:hypothetical protein